MKSEKLTKINVRTLLLPVQFSNEDIVKFTLCMVYLHIMNESDIRNYQTFWNMSYYPCQDNPKCYFDLNFVSTRLVH